jgi:tetratricopeptide (TPR) repeat protein
MEPNGKPILRHPQRVKAISYQYQSGGMTTFPSFVSALADDLKSQTTAILCGAGISRHSGLPVVDQLVPFVLDTLEVPEDSRKTITTSSLPFEAFIETVRQVCNIDLLLDIFALGKPNTNHLLLAKLVRQGFLETICTTNFDTLIETAFDAEGLRRGSDYQVFSTEDGFDAIPWDSGVTRLIKIHGSIEDKDGVAITLRQVASEKLSVHRQGVINNLLSSRHGRLLVLGYSCSDIFDISPHIEAVKQSTTRVALIDHTSGKQTIADIRKKKEKNPFGGFDDGAWVRADTDALVKMLWSKLLSDAYRPPDQKDQQTNWRELVTKWGDRVKQQSAPGSNYRIAGRLLWRVSHPEDALQMYEKGLQSATDSHNLFAAAYIQGDMGTAHQDLGNYRDAAACYERALEMAEALVIDTGKTLADDDWRLHPPDKKEQGVWKGNLGTIYDQLGERKKAKENIEAALKIAQECGDEPRQVTWLGNLGMVLLGLGDFKGALDNFNRAVVRAAEIGDKEGESIWNGNLGKTLHDLGDYKSASARYERAMVVARQIGDRRREGIWIGGRGKARLRLGEREGALRDLEDALKIAKDTGDRENEGNWLTNLGNAFLSERDYEKAREKYERALELFESLGVRNSAAAVRLNLGSVLAETGDFSAAIDAFQKSASELRQLGNKVGEGTVLGNLGQLYLSLGDHANAVEQFDLALSILTPILGNEHPTVKQIDRNWSLSMQQRRTGG